MISSLDMSPRDEVSMLRKKVVTLETAESDNNRLRKEMTKIEMKMQEEKSKFELDFMNQLSQVIRDNAMKMEEINSQLLESNKINCSLREELNTSDPRSDMMKKKMQDLKNQHKYQLTQLIDESNRKFSEVAELRRQLYDTEKSREFLMNKVEESIKLSEDSKCLSNKCPNSILKNKSVELKTQKFRRMTDLDDENQKLKNAIKLLQQEKKDIKVTLEEYKEREIGMNAPPKLEGRAQIFRNSDTEMQNESRDINESSHRTNNGIQTRELCRSLSLPSTNLIQQKRAETSESHTTRTAERLAQKSIYMGTKTKNTNWRFGDTKLRLFDVKGRGLKKELEPQMEYLSDREKAESRKREGFLNSQLDALHDTVSSTERSRAALVLDKEKLTREMNQMTEKKIELEQKVKRQRQQLKQLQKMVEENLNQVEEKHKNNEIQIQRVKDQNQSLQSKLLSSENEICELNQTIVKRKEADNTIECTTRDDVQSLHSQMDKLQKEQNLRQMELSEVERRYKEEIGVLENKLESTRLELGEKIRARDMEIAVLKGHSDEKYGAFLRLEKEKEQLVLSMHDMMKNRRAEIDDLQAEIVKMNTQLANKTREVSALKSTLKGSTHQKREMNHLRKKIDELSRKLAMKTNNGRNPGNSSVEKENIELRRKLKEASKEQLLAKEKLQKCFADRGSGISSKSAQAIRGQNLSLQCEVERLMKRLKNISEKSSNTLAETERCRERKAVTRTTMKPPKK